MNLLAIVVLRLFVIVLVSAAPLTPIQQLMSRVSKLIVAIEEYETILQNRSDLINRNEFWKLNELEMDLQDMEVEIDQAQNVTDFQDLNKQIDEIEKSIESEIRRIETILEHGPTTQAPLSKEQLLKRAVELEQILEQVINILKLHPLLHIKDLAELGAQEAELKLLSSELENTSDKDPEVNHIEVKLGEIEMAVESELSRLNDIIRYGTTQGPAESTSAATPLSFSTQSSVDLSTGN